MDGMTSGAGLSNAIEAIRAGMLTAPDAQSRFAILSSHLDQCGFDQINYGFFDPEAARRDEAEVIFLSTMQPGWIEHYYADALHVTDPHVVKVRQGNMLPYRWGESEVTRIDEPGVRNTARRIEEAGLRSAICTPLASPFAPAIPVAGMTLGSSLPGRELEGITGFDAWRLVSLVHLFHQLSLGELHRRRVGAILLSERERDCLRFSADGMLQDAIAHRLGVARVTVETHLRNARRKLKARTLAQAVARAIAFGEIPPA